LNGESIYYFEYGNIDYKGKFYNEKKSTYIMNILKKRMKPLSLELNM